MKQHYRLGDTVYFTDVMFNEHDIPIPASIDKTPVTIVRIRDKRTTATGRYDYVVQLPAGGTVFVMRYEIESKQEENN